MSSPCCCDDDVVSLLRRSWSSRRCGDFAGLGGAISSELSVALVCSGSSVKFAARYGRSESPGDLGTDSGSPDAPVTVLDRVRVRGRRERLTPLARLELLATERMEGGLWAGQSAIGVVKEKARLLELHCRWSCLLCNQTGPFDLRMFLSPRHFNMFASLAQCKLRLVVNILADLCRLARV